MAAPPSADVESLAAMFPDVEKPVIETILEAQGGDSNRAIDAILVLQGQTTAVPAVKPSPQVESDLALAKALQEKMNMEEPRPSRNEAKEEFISSEDLKAVGEAFENMGKAISRGWRDLTEKLSEVPLYSFGKPAAKPGPSDDDVRLVRRSPTQPTLPETHDPAAPAMSPDSGNPLLEPSDPDAVLTLARAAPAEQQAAPKN